MTLHSHQQCIGVPFPPLVWSVFFILVITVGELSCLTVVLVCKILTTNNVKHLFMYLFAIHISYLLEDPDVFPHF